MDSGGTNDLSPSMRAGAFHNRRNQNRSDYITRVTRNKHTPGLLSTGQELIGKKIMPMITRSITFIVSAYWLLFLGANRFAVNDSEKKWDSEIGEMNNMERGNRSITRERSPLHVMSFPSSSLARFIPL